MNDAGGPRPELIIRADRVVTADGIVPRSGSHQEREGRRRRPSGRHAGPGRGHPAGRRRGAAARPRRHARARQRAGAHRVGGLRHRDRGRGGRRRHDDRRHAAELDAADDRRRGARAQARGRAGAVPVDVGFWGGRRARQRASPGARCTRPACSASSASWSTRACPSSRRWTRPGSSAPPGRRPSFGSRCSCTPRTRRCVVRRRRPATTRAFVRSRPDEAETAAVALVARDRRGAPARGCTSCTCPARRCCRCSARRSADGVPVTAETCPHYLALAAEDVPDGATQFKCCPPIRDRANRDQLWDALRAGLLDCVVSDHSPCPPELKRLDAGDFGAAWGGIASLQLGAAGGLDGRAASAGCTLADVARWMSAAPAPLAGLAGQGRDRGRARRRPGGVRAGRELHRRRRTCCGTGTS